MTIKEISININRETEEIIALIVNEMGILTYTVEDPELLVDYSKEPRQWDYYDLDEDTIKDLKNRDKYLKIYVDEQELDEKIKELEQGILKYNLNPEFHSFTIKDIVDTDWQDNWKDHFKLIELGEDMVIKPSFIDYKGERNKIVEIDPGMAFGTGDHETTALTLEAMERYLKPGDDLYDIGTGSGILAIMAKKLGANNVYGIDLDERAIEAAKNNIIINDVEDIIIRHGDLLDTFDQKADVIVANILAEAIVELAIDLKGFLKEDGYFIASGILLEKSQLVKDALLKEGFTVLEENSKGDWIAIVAEVDNG